MRKQTIRAAIYIFLAALLLSGTHLIAASVGVEWINNFAGTVNDRSHWDESAEGLYNEMTAAGWYGKFHWGNANTWMSDFTTNNNSWIDSVDIALIGTHGSSGYDSFWGADLSSVMFSTGTSDSFMHPGQVYNLWGDYNLEWIALDCCSVLRDSSVGQWRHAMNGLHQLLGFKNTMYVSLPGDGKKWGQYMTGSWWPLWGDFPFTVTQSWFLAVDYVQPHGWTTVTARVLAEVNNNYNDYAWGEGYVSPDPVKDGTYWIWDHNAGCPPPRVNTAASEMMVYKAVEETINEEQASSIARTLGLEGKIIFREDGYFSLEEPLGDGKFFQIHKNGGLFFGNADLLFKVPEKAPTLPSEEGGLRLANEFLAKLRLGGLDLGDLGEPEFETEIIFEYSSDREGKGEPLDQMPILSEVFFPHELTYNGQTFSVVGPGAKLKVYLGDGGEVIGAIGGWRKLEETKPAEFLPQEEALALVKEYRDKVSLLKVPPFEDFEAKEATLAYYEDVNEIILTTTTIVFPSWLFKGTFYTREKDGRAASSFEGDFYLPAVEEFIPPVVTIISPEDNSVHSPTERIEFKAEVKFGAGGETIQWFSDIDGYLGEGDLILASLSGGAREGEEVSHSVKAVATDSRGKTGTAIVTVKITEKGAGPWVLLGLNDTMFMQGDELILTISGGNNSVPYRVCLFVFLVTPDGRLIFWPWWSPLAIPLVLDFPAAFEIDDLVLLDTTLPSMTPRIGGRGNYRFWAFLTNSSTGEMLGPISEVGFTME